MKRRGFLGALGAAIAGATLDPERALWVPGARVISVPRASRNMFIAPTFVTRYTLRILQQNLVLQREMNRQASMQIEFLTGETWNVRLPRAFVGRRG